MELKHLPLNLQVLVGSTELPLTAYHDLQVGDIVLLEQPLANPLTVSVQDEPLFRGSVGFCETKKAVRIDERIYN